MTVEGPDPDGTFFREDTSLAFMSHQGALFPLWSPVALGSRLKLAIALPPKLGEGRNLTLVVKGTIVDVDQGDADGSPPRSPCASSPGTSSRQTRHDPRAGRPKPAPGA